MLSHKFVIADFSHKNFVIITKLGAIAVVLWFLPPINSLVNSKQQRWITAFTLIDDNKFVSWPTNKIPIYCLCISKGSVARVGGGVGDV